MAPRWVRRYAEDKKWWDASKKSGKGNGHSGRRTSKYRAYHVCDVCDNSWSFVDRDLRCCGKCGKEWPKYKGKEGKGHNTEKDNADESDKVHSPLLEAILLAVAANPKMADKDATDEHTKGLMSFLNKYSKDVAGSKKEEDKSYDLESMEDFRKARTDCAEAKKKYDNECQKLRNHVSKLDKLKKSVEELTEEQILLVKVSEEAKKRYISASAAYTAFRGGGPLAANVPAPAPSPNDVQANAQDDEGGLEEMEVDTENLSDEHKAELQKLTEENAKLVEAIKASELARKNEAAALIASKEGIVSAKKRIRKEYDQKSYAQQMEENAKALAEATAAVLVDPDPAATPIDITDGDKDEDL